MCARPSSSSAKKAARSDLLPVISALVKALDAKKAGDLRVLYVGEQSNITDYLILASGQANPHLRALRVELEKVLDGLGVAIAGVDATEGSGWVVFDAYQVMIHLFMPEQRELYRLEQLWRDAEDVDISAMLPPPPAPVPSLVPTSKAAAAKKTPAAKKKTAAKSADTVTPAKKPAAKKAPAKKAAKKTAVKKAPTKKTPAKKAATRKKA